MVQVADSKTAEPPRYRVVARTSSRAGLPSGSHDCAWMVRAAMVAFAGVVMLACSPTPDGAAGAADTSTADTLAADTLAADTLAADTFAADTGATINITPNLSHDLIRLDLTLDLSTNKGVAHWKVMPAFTGGSVTFEVGGLSDITVLGSPSYQHSGKLLHVSLPATDFTPSLMISYTFKRYDAMIGLMNAGSSVTWPRHCSNLFPCHSAPSEGFSYTLKVKGLAKGDVAVFASEVTARVPSYAVALAIGAYSYHKVGETQSGLELGVWLRPDQLGTDGKLDLPGIVDWPKAVSWLEATLGPYPYGKQLAAVTVPWGPMAYGGLEMHPIYHVSDLAIGDLAVHCHESAHGWFGNGVRIACWEDLVLSEGVADYLMVRAMAAAKGEQVMQPMFAAMEKSVAAKAGTQKDVVVWQSTCDEIDVEASGVSAKITYHKGALFLRAVAQQVGVAKLDAALGVFVKTHLGNAVRFSALLDVIAAETGFDPKPLAKTWLQSKGDPLAP